MAESSYVFAYIINLPLCVSHLAWVVGEEAPLEVRDHRSVPALGVRGLELALLIRVPQLLRRDLDLAG